jgi:phosphatidylcholine synthase
MAGREGPPYTAWLVHLYTASSAVLAFLATVAVFESRFRDAFFWLGITIIIDATDGILARAARVSARIPWFNGAQLDDLVDYLTYVFVPTLVVWRGLLVPESWMVVVAGAMLLASGYGFSRADAKTADHAFTGFPSYWNLVVFYLYLMHLSPITNAIVLLALAVMVFVPLRYVYPSRMPRLRALTNTLGALWGVVLLAIVWQLPSISPVLLWGSLLYPVYYFALSAALYI